MGTELKTILSMNGQGITGDAEGMVNLTELWRAAGGDKEKKPVEWLRSKTAIEFIASLASNLKVGIPTLTKTRRGGRAPGTWAHWQVALAYAKWVDPTFHQNVNAAFVQWVEEANNPELKINRALDRWKQIGRDEEWVGTRLKGLLQRRSLTSTLSDHNCRERSSYKTITNTGNLACLGKTAREIKAAKGLPKSAPTRDHMEKHELAALCFFEAMTEKRIKDVAADGDDECVAAAQIVGKAVKTAIQAVEQTRLPSHAA